MASERDLKELQARQDRRRQDDHLDGEGEENDLHHKMPKKVQELVEKLRKELAKKDTQLAEKDTQIAKQEEKIERLESRKNPSTPQRRSSLISGGKAFDGQSCTPRAADIFQTLP
jgi:hypothetical protein